MNAQVPSDAAPIGRRLRSPLALYVLVALASSPLAGCAWRRREPPPPVETASVKPGINDRFLSPDMDINWAVGAFEANSREIFVERVAITKAIGVNPGESVADVGAGTGLFLNLLAQVAYPGGRVYAIDISPALVAFLQKRIQAEKTESAVAVLGTDKTIELPDGAIDVAFLCDTYHHFEYPRSMLHSIHRALRPGGRLVIVDFDRIPGVSRDWTLEHVRADKETVRAEVEAAGFTFIDSPPIQGLEETYMLRFRS